MTWELALSIFGALFGSGGLIGIFLAGRRIGSLEAQLGHSTKRVEDLAAEMEDVKSSARNVAGATSRDVTDKHTELRNNLFAAINSCEVRLEEKVTDVIETIDNITKEVADVKQSIQVTIAGLQGQRADWDQLKQDIRSLLQNNAAAQESKENIKHTLLEHGSKIDSQNEKTTTLKADISRLFRLEGEIDRLKEELSRLKSHRS